MIQVSMEKVSELLARNGIDLADEPDLAAQIMAVNERLAATPGFSAEVFQDFVSRMLSTGSDAPIEPPAEETNR